MEEVPPSAPPPSGRPSPTRLPNWAYAPGLVGTSTDPPSWVFWAVLGGGVAAIGLLGLFLVGLL
ncbi:MAG TPA: hypothetical protein VMG99_06010 [Thermoplasmata archaeon]|jgi:hypothetical protein|nr:hypothetical protein [Thermoplasmata archaeon]